VRILRCVRCDQPAQIDTLMLTLEASEGLRESHGAAPKWSPIRTVTRGIMVCDTCFAHPEMAIVRKMITSDLTESDLFNGRHCVVLCRYMRRRWWHRWLFKGEASRVIRGRVTCPSCFRPAHAWARHLAPPKFKAEADDTVLGREAEAFQVAHVHNHGDAA
jgi:hypothetical protein